MTFLTSTLLGGLRFVGDDYELRFVAPSLVALVLGLLLVFLFVKTGLVRIADWLSETRTPLENASNGLTLLSLYFGSVQVFNAVIPEDTLFHAVFALFFVVVIWNNFFALVRPDRLVRSLGGLFLAAFFIKYALLVGVNEPADSLTGTIARSLLRGITLGGLESEAYTRASGYTAFASVALYLLGLWATSPPRDERLDILFDALQRGSLTAGEETRLLALSESSSVEDAIDAEIEEKDGA